MEFSSAGFDLDSLQQQQQPVASSCEEEVIYEIGGGVSRISLSDSTTSTSKKKNGNDAKVKDEDSKTNANFAAAADDDDTVMKQADWYKEQGNDAFREKNWLLAYEKYTLAMKATPGLTGPELLKLRDEFVAQERKLARIALQQQEQARKRKKEQELQRKRQQEQERKSGTTCASEPTNSSTNSSSTNDVDEEDESESPPPAKALREEFQAPPHDHGTKLAIYHCNRSACLLQLQRYEEALDDCDVSLLWNPTYTKAWVRRSKIHELLGDEHLEAALKDATRAAELEPGNPHTKATIKRLETLHRDYMERLKTETMDKLKDLGNSILGNFGLSLDNFKAVQDPKTGSYSISFGQNNNSDNNSGTK